MSHFEEIIPWDKAWGYGGRVGLIMPAMMTVTEHLYYAIAPEGVSFYTSRIQIVGKGLQSIAQSETQVDRAVAELMQSKVNCIAYLCVTGGLVRGLDGEREFCRGIEKQTGVPVISALLSAVEALNVLKMRRLVVTGPYPDEYNELERKELQNSGFEVLGIYGLGLTSGFAFGQVTPREIYDFCLECWNPSADGMFIACANFNAMPVVERLEKELGVPVVTAHSAVFWKILRTLNIKKPLPNLGRLLSEHVAN